MVPYLYMLTRNIAALLLTCSLSLPLSSHAAVVTSAELDRLTADANALANSCQLVNDAIGARGMSSAPVWKKMNLTATISMKYPWSPMWYILGKQIPWFDASGVGSFYSLGRLVPDEACSVSREYAVDVISDQSIKQFFGPRTDGPANGTIAETFTLNGFKAAIVGDTSGICAQQQLAVEVTKKKKTTLVLLTHHCSDVNTELVRMAATIR